MTDSQLHTILQQAKDEVAKTHERNFKDWNDLYAFYFKSPATINRFTSEAAILAMQKVREERNINDARILGVLNIIKGMSDNASPGRGDDVVAAYKLAMNHVMDYVAPLITRLSTPGVKGEQK